MLLQALAEYADHYLADQLNDAAWETKPVPWLLEISRQGTFLNVTPRMTSETRGKKQVSVPMIMRVPRSPVNRNSGHHPLLGADDISYILGAGPWTPDKQADREKATKHHESFISLLNRAADQTGEAALEACVRFYSNAAEVERARQALHDAKTGSVVALSVGEPLVDLEPVQSFWRRHYQAEFSARMGATIGECLISGATGAIAPTHEKIKGASSLGGQASGVALMSFDKEAFRSYGWDQNQNSPVSPDRALAYVLALNDLMRPNGGAKEKQRRQDIAGIGFLYWLRDPSDFDLFETLNPPDETSVQELLKLKPVDLDANEFYMAGVSGNGGRLRVRYWVTDSLEHIKTNIRQWREQLSVAYPWGDPGPVRFWQLLYAVHREGKPPAHHTLALLRRVIEGRAQPLGHAMLAAVLGRLRHPENENSAGSGRKDPRGLQALRIPVGLVRLCVNDIQRVKKGEEMSEGLDETCRSRPYVYGRLMALYENLQWKADDAEQKRRRDVSGSKEKKDINVTVTDRYFALASTCPSAAFPRIINLANAHKRKLRRDDPGAAAAIELRLGDVYSLLEPGPFLNQLSIEGQGLFALGYYHQKAWSMGQARDRKQSNDSATNDPSKETE